MIPYQFYKVLHFFSIFVFIVSSSLLLLVPDRARFFNALSGVAALLILTAGMGLMARLGGGFQPWIVAKMVIWFLVTGFIHFMAKRFPHKAQLALWVMIALTTLAAFFAVYKPI